MHFFNVAAYKKIICALLVVIAVGAAAPLLCAGEEKTAEQTKSLLQNPNSLFAGDCEPTDKPQKNTGTKELFFTMTKAVLLVVVLGAAAIYFSKKFLPRIANLPGKEVRIIETIHLGSRRTLHLLKIGNQRILIGSTGEKISKLADVTEAFSETEPS